MQSTILFASAATLILATQALAAEEHREAGPHEHGHGTFNIAIEKARVALELEVPGMDLVGFEHEARSKDDEAAVDKAKQQLAAPLSLFKIPAAAGCKVASTDIKIEAGEHHDEGDKEHAKDEHEEEGHNEFHVTYALDCANPAALTAIEFDYFTSFPGANKLTVNVVTEKAQSQFEVTRDQPKLDLGGMM